MAISMSNKRKSRLSKKVDVREFSFFYSILAKVLSQIPVLAIFLIIIFLWSSSTTIISGKIVHLCVSSRKLNNLYCISAGTQPDFHIPIPLTNGSSNVVGSSKETPALSPPSSHPTTYVGSKGTPALSPSTSHPAINVRIKETPALSPPSIHPTVNIGSSKETPALSPPNSHPTSNVGSKGTPVLSPPSSHPTINVGSSKETPALSPSNSHPTSNVGSKETPALSPPNSHPTSNVGSSKETPALSPPSLHPMINVGSKRDENSANEDAINVNAKNSVSFIYNSSDQYKNEELAYAYMDVEEQLRMHRSWISTSNQNHENCEGRGVYVYELPSKFNKDLLAQCDDMIPWVSLCKYFSNNALGEPIEKLGKSWYQTHQYALEPIFHARILNHTCRVYNENEAKIFYVPFYGGLDILRWHFKNVTEDVKDSLSLEMVRWLETQRPWFRNYGKDHVFVLGKISWDFRRDNESSWGTRFLELDEMQNPIKLLIERQPWHGNDIGIPHPTYFHPQTDDEIIQWQMKIISSYRRNIASFAGADRPDSSDNIRSILIEQCTMKNEECKFLNCNSGECHKPESLINLFLESEFCLQPPGDSPTRKSVFDSIISGCIPVIFDPFTAYYQYPWHLPEDHKKYSVFIDKDEVKIKNVNVVERLANISQKDKDDMRRYIVYQLMPRLVYADPNNSKLEKFQDAFSVTISNLIERMNTL